MNPAPLLRLPLLTRKDLAFYLQFSDRHVATLCGGPRKKAQITKVRIGREDRFTVEAYDQFILQHTIAAVPGPNGFVRLEPEQFELFWQRHERLVRDLLEAERRPRTREEAA